MKRVLFVDDDEEDMFLFDKAMRAIDEQLDIYYAVCGDDLYYFLNTSLNTSVIARPDLLFVDVNLPGLNGIECLQKIRLDDKELLIPIIVYSAFTSVEMIDECYKENANYYIIKSREFEKTMDLLRTALSINWANDRFPTRDNFVIQ